MKIVLATPLYPPEIAEPAPYIKELAKRLAKLHEVTVVAYTRLPEEVPGARMLVVDKRRPLPIRLIAYFFALVKTTRHADIMYAMNGTSVELPVALTSLFVNRPFFIGIGDIAAHNRAKKTLFSRLIEQFSFSRARTVVSDMPLARPEVLPFEPFPKEKFETYERSWSNHIRTLESIFNHDVT